MMDAVVELEMDAQEGKLNDGEAYSHNNELLPEVEAETVEVDESVSPQGGGAYESSLAAFMANAANHPLLSAEDELKTARAAKRGCITARNKMVTHNLRLVVKNARRYALGSEYMIDYIQEGVLGLFRAIEKFDPEKGFRFTTYASWWIDQNIRRATASVVRDVRWPVHIDNLQRRYRKLQAQCFQRGEVLTDERIGQEIDLNREQVSRLLLIYTAEISANQPLGSNDENTALIDTFETNDDVTTEGLSNKELSHSLETALAQTLNQREIFVLRNRFGLGCEGKTLESVGEDIGLTRERVRQIETVALRKLRDRYSREGMTILDFFSSD